MKNPTDTPRTDAMYETHTSEYQRRLLSEDLERKLAAEIANREKCCRDGNAISDELFDTQQKLKKAEAELEFLKTAGIIEVAVRNSSVKDYMEHWEERAEKAEAEVERLRDALKSCFWATNTYDGNYARACDNVATIVTNALKTQDNPTKK